MGEYDNRIRMCFKEPQSTGKINVCLEQSRLIASLMMIEFTRIDFTCIF